MPVGGKFTAIGGQARDGLAKIPAGGDGSPDPTWNPTIDGDTVALRVFADRAQALHEQAHDHPPDQLGEHPPDDQDDQRRRDAEATQDAIVLDRAAEQMLNHRPRACLGYRTPHEVFHGVSTPLCCD